MLFQQYEDNYQEKQKTAIFMKNVAHSSKQSPKKVELNLFKGIQIRDITPKLKSKFRFTRSDNRLRIFNSHGVELFEEDLQYVKDNCHLYVTEGENFDSSIGLAQYHQIRVIGEGGFGRVILAQHRVKHNNLNNNNKYHANTTNNSNNHPHKHYHTEKVAIKIVRTAQISNAHDIDMVFREVEILQSLKHTNIVQIHKCFTILPMQTVFVMEYLEGGELTEYVRSRGRLPEQEARLIFQQIADAISYCHRVKLLHRDLKCENILFSTEERKQVKIVDFGIAGLSVKINNVQNVNQGSLCYMPPEVVSGQAKQVDPSIDIWALGCILFVMLTGELPFKMNQSVEEIIFKITRGIYQFPKNVQLTRQAKTLIQKMLCVDPDERITIQDVLQNGWVARGNQGEQQYQQMQSNDNLYSNNNLNDNDIDNEDYDNDEKQQDFHDDNNNEDDNIQNLENNNNKKKNNKHNLNLTNQQQQQQVQNKISETNKINANNNNINTQEENMQKEEDEQTKIQNQKLIEQEQKDKQTSNTQRIQQQPQKTNNTMNHDSNLNVRLIKTPQQFRINSPNKGKIFTTPQNKGKNQDKEQFMRNFSPQYSLRSSAQTYTDNFNKSNNNFLFRTQQKGFFTQQKQVLPVIRNNYFQNTNSTKLIDQNKRFNDFKSYSPKKN